MAKPKAKQPTANPPMTVHEIPLRRPPKDSKRDPNTKTLIDLIDEHHPNLSKLSSSNRVVELDSDAESAEKSGRKGEDDDEDSYEPSQLGDAVFMAVPFTFLFTVLDILSRKQYSQEATIQGSALAAARAFPVLLILNYYMHHRRNNRLMRLAFFVASISAGMWMIHATNRYGYYAVMKKAPGVGTLWVWCVIELDAALAALSCVIVAAFFKMGNYSF